jgi:hypothetical protein
VAALAIAVGFSIWTADQDFFGSGVATWTADRVELLPEGRIRGRLGWRLLSPSKELIRRLLGG